MSEMSFGAGAEARGRMAMYFSPSPRSSARRRSANDQRETYPIVYGKRLPLDSIFTFPVCCSSLPRMTNLWFSATYYYGVFGYNRWGPGSRVR
jgi:hypothetical protein